MKGIPKLKNIPFVKRIRVYRKKNRRRKRFVRELKKDKEIKIVIGACEIFDDGWIPSEQEFLDLLSDEDWQSFFHENSIDAMLADHVWEHLSEKDGMSAAKNCFKYLKPGGYLRIAVPDGLHPDSSYIDYVKPGSSGVGDADHKTLYTYKSLSAILKNTGFGVLLLEYWDETGKFHFNAWDPGKGKIRRSMRFDIRNQDGELKYTSLIVDALKARVD